MSLLSCLQPVSICVHFQVLSYHGKRAKLILLFREGKHARTIPCSRGETLDKQNHVQRQVKGTDREKPIRPPYVRGATLPDSSRGGRSYTMGEIPGPSGGKHTVVIALLTSAGTTTAAVRADYLLHDFPHVVANGHAFASATKIEGNSWTNKISAFESSSGRVLWTTVLPDDLGPENLQAKDGLVYVLGYLHNPEGYVLRALDAGTRKIRWQSPVPLPGSRIWGSMVVSDKIYVSLVSQSSLISAFDLRTGKQTWKVAEVSQGTSSLVVSNATIYMLSEGGLKVDPFVKTGGRAVVRATLLLFLVRKCLFYKILFVSSAK